MVFKIIIFLGVILALTIGAHLFLYRGLIRLFVITSPGIKTFLFIALLLLSLSFMASFFLVRWQENLLTIGFYMFAATWIGLFLNLLLAVVLSWFIIAAIWISGSYPHTKIITSGCLLLAVIFSAYGVWNAFHPAIKKLEIEFENLPPQWKNKVIVQLSDIHLGHFYGENFLESLVKKVNALDPELIFITGDLFDGMASRISHFAPLLNRFKAEKGVYFISGNHETYIGVKRVLGVLRKTEIKILQNEAIEIDGLQIVGIPYPGINGTADLQGLEKLQQPPAAAKPLILLFHTPTNISPQGGDGFQQHFATYWVPDTSFSLARKLGVDLQLSGHTHAGQIFPFSYLTSLIYKGYDHGLKHIDNFSIYTTSGVGTWGPPLRTGNSPEIVLIKMKAS
jgi:predicted MPP superfamily phosphohydrolase